ncbi:MAG: hypothetical protein HHAS10_10280 [Candidatus Altimarinota bacterium]
MQKTSEISEVFSFDKSEEGNSIKFMPNIDIPSNNEPIRIGYFDYLGGVEENVKPQVNSIFFSRYAQDPGNPFDINGILGLIDAEKRLKEKRGGTPRMTGEIVKSITVCLEAGNNANQKMRDFEDQIIQGILNPPHPYSIQVPESRNIH